MGTTSIGIAPWTGHAAEQQVWTGRAPTPWGFPKALQFEDSLRVWQLVLRQLVTQACARWAEVGDACGYTDACAAQAYHFDTSLA
jgi:hypothetical protein